MDTNSQGLQTDVDFDKFVAFAEQYHADPELRSQIDADTRGVLTEKGFVLPPALEVRVVANTDDTFHFTFPPDPNTSLSDEALAAVAGGKSASSAGSAGTASTLGTATGITVGSASSASSAGCAGSAG